LMSDSQAEDLRNEALRKIGRNIVNLQRMERYLKLLVVRINLNGYISEMEEVYRKRLKDVERLTMGTLVDKLTDGLYSSADPSLNPPDNLKGVWVSSTFRIEGGAEQKKTAKKALTLVVKERNKLVHRMLGEFDSASVESCRELIDLLDQQQERIAPHFDGILGLLRLLDESRMKLVEALKDGELLEWMVRNGSNL
jgi:hypothetical protein